MPDSGTCDPDTGACYCVESFGGFHCDECRAGECFPYIEK